MSGDSFKEGGQKQDNGKLPISLIPVEAIFGAASALSYGAKKYSQHNFKKGLNHSRIIDAALRHVFQYLSGEDLDIESGLSHIDHALASLAMLKYLMVNKPELDDRYKEGVKCQK